ncbi:ECF transporter S component [Bilifractor porci]|uniref:ECF transporter S component n=1 Tax=Bilifractor porci TaxID=2606636 RepID=A0A7X2TNZ6_9FIRM|nr:ECF transporter S component [Bilifractor porci]MST82809.1 ECF transporter S component [Bilifractor porci]
MNKKQGNTQKLAVLAVLTAIVIILQAAVVIPLGPFTVTLTMLPIIIGAIMYGPLGGAVLGTVFGAVVSIQVLTGAAGAFSTAMLEYQPAATILICLLKGIAAGLAAGAFFCLFRKVSFYFGVVMAAVIAPVVNTGIFSVGCLTIFRSLIQDALGTGSNLLLVFLTTFIGLNFLVEFGINVALTPVVMRIFRAVKLEPAKAAG